MGKKNMSNSSGVMVLGVAILAFKAGFSSDNLIPLLKKYGFDGEIDETAWYERRDLLAMLEEATHTNPSIDLISVGLQVVKMVSFPPDISSVEEALRNYDLAYRATHKNLPEGDGLEFERLNENTYLVTDRTPYPTNCSYGAVFGLVERYAPPGAHVSVHTEELDGYRVFRIVVR
jgi:hypothetical protein